MHARYSEPEQKTDLQRERERRRKAAILAKNPHSAASLQAEAERLAERNAKMKRYVRFGTVAISLTLGAMMFFQYHVQKKRPPVKVTVPPGNTAPMPSDIQLPVGLIPFPYAQLPDTTHLAAGSKEAQEQQVAYSLETGLPIEVINDLGIRFRLIPPGTFTMGSPESEKERHGDETAHEVTISQAFYLGTFEITQAQWEEVFGEKANSSWFRHPGSDYPVEEVPWTYANRFASKLAEREGAPGWTYRLPTEEEWEYACRAGTATPWHFGERAADLYQHDVYAGFRHNGPEPVGQRRPNSWGLFNMHGNVWEWCGNLFYYYDRPDIKDPI